MMKDTVKRSPAHHVARLSGRSDLHRRILRRVAIVLTIALLGASPALARIAVDGCYWTYNGRRTLLLGGWNHAHNPFIDHDTANDTDSQGVSTIEEIQEAMDLLAQAGGNYLRCVLDPGMAAGIQGFDFCARAGERYDLDTMTGPFWTRLEMFIAEARKREMVVQIELWDRFDLIGGRSWDSWPVSPWNPKNNINYTTDSSGLATSYGGFSQHPFLQCVPGHPAYEEAPAARREQYDVIRRYQDKFVEKLLSMTLRYDNVLYCMNNETHEHAAWGQYWMRFIRDKAKARGREVLTTDMFDDIYRGKDSRGVAVLRSQRDRYDYVDVSQANSRHADEAHWNTVMWLIETLQKTETPYLLHMTKVYGNDLALKGQPWSEWRPGDTDNAIEEWWRNLIAGMAGVRFHRPTAGIGLSPLARNCIRATRKVEAHVRFWDVQPRLDLLTDRESDEAYLAAAPGKAYILYFTRNGAGSVGLKLDGEPDTAFTLRWINIDTGDWGPTATLSPGGTVTLTRPSNEAHWAATIVR